VLWRFQWERNDESSVKRFHCIWQEERRIKCRGFGTKSGEKGWPKKDWNKDWMFSCECKKGPVKPKECIGPERSDGVR